jgi:hypothetical protein
MIVTYAVGFSDLDCTLSREYRLLFILAYIFIILRTIIYQYFRRQSQLFWIFCLFEDCIFCFTFLDFSVYLHSCLIFITGYLPHISVAQSLQQAGIRYRFIAHVTAFDTFRDDMTVFEEMTFDCSSRRFPQNSCSGL